MIEVRFTGAVVPKPTIDGPGTVAFTDKRIEEMYVHIAHMQPGDSLIVVAENTWVDEPDPNER